jgi:hypothetical protein
MTSDFTMITKHESMITILMLLPCFIFTFVGFSDVLLAKAVLFTSSMRTLPACLQSKPESEYQTYPLLRSHCAT